MFGEDFGLHCGLAITVVERLQRYNSVGATHFKEMMIPLFVQKRKNFVCDKIRLGLFLDLCFTPVLKQPQKPERGKQNWFRNLENSLHV